MSYIVITLLLFFLLLLFPIVHALYWYRRDADSSVLQVRQERTRDPRYFARSFEAKLLEAWPGRADGRLTMSRESEEYLLADEAPADAYAEPCEKLVVAENKPFVLPQDAEVRHEVYSFHDARLQRGARVRAIRARGDLVLGQHASVVRWADADGTVVAYPSCDMGISVTSCTAITLGENCRFRRLYAPVIHLGAYPGDNTQPVKVREKRIYRMEETAGEEINSRHISSDDTDDTGVLNASVITNGNVTLDENLIVSGNIRSRKGVQIAENSVVCGSVFADKDVHLSRNCTVLGSVFTQGDVYCEDGVVIGCPGRTSSVIARGTITIEKDCFVYGYVSNEGGGVTWPIDEKDLADRPPMDEVPLPWPEHDPVLVFDGKEDFEHVDSQGFRCHDYLTSVAIPLGVTRISHSTFFKCSNLEHLDLPVTLESIGEYAFADCTSLRTLDLSGLVNLRSIERSAFDGCTDLEWVKLPAGLEVLGPAAFFGCSKLAKVDIPAVSALRQVGSHCFQECPVVVPQAERLQHPLTEQEGVTSVL